MVASSSGRQTGSINFGGDITVIFADGSVLSVSRCAISCRQFEYTDDGGVKNRVELNRVRMIKGACGWSLWPKESVIETMPTVVPVA